MDNSNLIEEQKMLTKELREAADVYEQGSGREMMTNFEYDAKFDRLKELEALTGIILSGSPTQEVGALVMDELPSVTHEFPALSLDKTKDVAELVGKFIQGDINHMGMMIMPKWDGGTIVLTYSGGELILAASRGNGHVGQDISHNAPFIEGVPLTIPYTGKLIVRGEVLMSYSEFEHINKIKEENGEELYANPRNLANATALMLDSNEVKSRHLAFKCYNLVYIDMPIADTFTEQFNFLETQGFAVTIHQHCTAENLEEYIRAWSDPAFIENIGYPLDGLVVALEDRGYAKTLTGTGHHENVMNGMALKWADEEYPTVLRDIILSPSRTGLLNPVAVFDPVEINGATITRASLFNLSYIKQKRLRPNAKVSVFLANCIIPQIATNYSYDASDDIADEEYTRRVCPCCGRQVTIRTSNSTESLYCINPGCPAKLLKSFVHFCEKDCMDISGISERSIEDLVGRGYIREYADFFKLDRYADEIMCMDGWGEKSYTKLISACEEARKVSLVNFLHAVSIPNVGNGQAKLILAEVRKYALENAESIRSFTDRSSFSIFATMCYDEYDWTKVEGFGSVIADSLTTWFSNNLMSRIVYCESSPIENLVDELTFTDDVPLEAPAHEVLPLAGKTFVITGNVFHYPNRAALQQHIESLGGKVAGSVSKNTSYLINNDVTSTSGKNKKAKELGVPIISEDDFLRMIGE